MSDKIVKCKKCGSEDFWLNEGYSWEAHIEDGVINATSACSEVERVFCKNCEEEIDWTEYEINFN